MNKGISVHAELDLSECIKSLEKKTSVGNESLKRIVEGNAGRDDYNYFHNNDAEHFEFQNLRLLLKYAVQENNKLVEDNLLKACVHAYTLMQIYQEKIYDDYLDFLVRLFQMDTSEYTKDSIKKHILMIFMLTHRHGFRFSVDDVKKVFTSGDFHVFFIFDDNAHKFVTETLTQDDLYKIIISINYCFSSSLYYDPTPIPMSIYLFFDDINITYDVSVCLLNAITIDDEDSKKFLLEKNWSDSVDYYVIASGDHLELLIEMEWKGMNINYVYIFMIAVLHDKVRIIKHILSNVSQMEGFEMINKIESFNTVEIMDIVCKFGYPTEKIWPKMININETTPQQAGDIIAFVYEKEGCLPSFLMDQIANCYRMYIFNFLREMNLIRFLLDENFLNHQCEKHNNYIISLLDIGGYDINCIRKGFFLSEEYKEYKKGVHLVTQNEWVKL